MMDVEACQLRLRDLVMSPDHDRQQVRALSWLGDEVVVHYLQGYTDRFGLYERVPVMRAEHGES